MFDRQTRVSMASVWLAAVLVPLQPASAAQCCCTQVGAAERVTAAADLPRHARLLCFSGEFERCGRKPRHGGDDTGSSTCCQSRLSGDRSHFECLADCCSEYEGSHPKPALLETRDGSGDARIQSYPVRGSDAVGSYYGQQIEAASSPAIPGAQRCIVLCRLNL